MNGKSINPEKHLMQFYQGGSNTNSLMCERLNITKPKIFKFCHFHDRYELYYLYSGERYYFIKDKTYHIKAGSLALIKPYDIHYTTNCANFGYDRHLLCFHKEYMAKLSKLSETGNILQCFESDIHVLNLNMYERNFVETLLHSLDKECNSEKADNELYKKTLLAQLMIFINRNIERFQSKDADYLNSSHKIVSEVTTYINSHYQEDITLYGTAGRFHVSPHHLSRIFKKYIGFTFTEYLNGIRVKEAQTLLRKTNIKIQDISEKVGFKSSTQFGRSFKKIAGISPNTYKKMHKKDS